MRLDLPDGAWAILFDAAKVPERKRRPVFRALVAFMASQNGEVGSKLDPAAVDLADDLNDALVVALVREWSFGEVSEAVLLDMPADAYRPLSAECAKHLDALMPNFSVSPDPKATTGS